MKLSPVLIVTTLLLFGPGVSLALGAQGPGQTGQATVSEPAHDAAAHEQALPAKEHDHSAMLAAQAAASPSEMDVLVKKMQTAKGQAKLTIMADLITKLVAERHAASAAGQGAVSSGGMCGGGHDASSGDAMACPMCAAHTKAGEHK
jgi:hypothetical protein